jgi:hypothetical protein
MLPELQIVTGEEQFQPAVVIIMPLEPKMCWETELAHSLRIAAGKVEQELHGE